MFAADSKVYLSAIMLPLIAAQLPFAIYRLWISEMERRPLKYYFSERELGELTDAFVTTCGYQQRYDELAAVAELQRSRCRTIERELDLLKRHLDYPRALRPELAAEAARIDFPIADIEPSADRLNLYPHLGKRNRRVAVLYVFASLAAAIAYKGGWWF
jgi:hypothetical protein